MRQADLPLAPDDFRKLAFSDTFGQIGVTNDGQQSYNQEQL